MPAATTAPPTHRNEQDVRAWRLHGALFFGAVKLIEDIELQLPRHGAILDIEHVIYLDSSGAEEMLHLARSCEKRGVTLILCGVMGQPLDMARRVRLLDSPGVLHEPDLSAALSSALNLLPAGQDSATVS